VNGVARRRLLGGALGVLALVLLGVAFLLFLILLGSALGEGPTDETADTALWIGFLVAGAGSLASLVGAIFVLASARRPGGQPEHPQRRTAQGWRHALGAVAFLVVLWLAFGQIFWNMGAASGGKAPLGSIVLILSLMGFATVFAGGLAAFSVRGGRRVVALVAVTAVWLYGLAAILAHSFGQGF